ncbi:MAG: hypothetical protein ABWZ25_14140 [Chitinophagaceae bacterium]
MRFFTKPGKSIEFNIYLNKIKEKFNKLPILKTSGMLEEYEQKRRKQVAGMRSMLDYGIGVAIVVAGAFLFFRNQFSFEFNEKFPPNSYDKIFGVICMLYGCWRVYRGYKKDYFK